MSDKKETFGGELAKKIPVDKVYEDVLHPALSEVGKGIKGVVKIALTPISAMVWAYDKISDYLDEAIPEYFTKKKTNAEKIITPDPSIAVPVIEAMRYLSKRGNTLHFREIKNIPRNESTRKSNGNC